jgi:diguanylate cyclase (GGDEF)-like protein
VTPSPSGTLPPGPPSITEGGFVRRTEIPAYEGTATGVEPTQLRDFSRTVAEIQWLLVILVLLYHVFKGAGEDHTVAIYFGLIAFTAAVLVFHYLSFARRAAPWLLAIETWVMIVFITWVLYHTGRLDSPLLNLYLLPIVTSALALGQSVTLLQVGLIAACYMFLGYSTDTSFFSVVTVGSVATALAPMLLVAYVTTMLSRDMFNAMGRIRQLSETDELTGVYNMRAFTSIAQREFALAKRYKRTFSLMMIDCDNLKKVNDTHGHEAGDRLIKHIVQSVMNEVRSTDVIVRCGGDEFMCLLPEAASAAATGVAERIRRRVADAALAAGGAHFATSVSIGIANHPDHGENLETVTRSADRALYLSKASGRNRVTVSPLK